MRYNFVTIHKAQGNEMNTDLTLLYIEDDAEILENVSFLLQRYVKKVYTAKDGEEALLMYEKHQPDILVSDINLPKLGGLEVVAKIREENKNIPVVLISAHDDEHFHIKAKAVNVSSYVIKPFRLQELTDAMQKAISEV